MMKLHINLSVAVSLATKSFVIGSFAAAIGTADAQITGPGAAARDRAPIDMTGFWVAVVTEDWRFRMVTPPKGDYNSVPLNSAARQIADGWDPERDEAAGEECRWYGAASIMSVPTRLHISWEDDNTLRIDTDAGMQTRVFRFTEDPEIRGAPTWQGVSTAAWRAYPGGREPGSVPGGSLAVKTAHLRPGYLRKNGVPYSADARLTEYYYVLPDGDTTWLILTSIVEDPTYLTEPFVTSRQFKRQPDDRGWNPTDCTPY